MTNDMTPTNKKEYPMSDVLFARQGNIFKPVPKAPSTAKDHLDAGVYVPSLTDEGELIVELISDNYSIPKEVYGDIVENANIVYDAYAERKGLPTGVILHGKKGAGKSLLAEMLSSHAINNNLPVFEIRKQIPGVFIRQLCEQCSPCVLFIDEVDRIYRNDYENKDMDGLVSVIGASSSKDVLTIITTNKLASLPDAFIDRPTRFLFCIDYSSIPEDVVRDVIIRKGYPQAVVDYLLKIRHSLTYDVMNAFLKLFTKFGSISKFEKFKHLYNLPTEDTFEVTIDAVLDVTKKKLLHWRDIDTNGTTFTLRTVTSSAFVDLTEFYSGDYPSGQYSYQTADGLFQVLLSISSKVDEQNDNRRLRFKHNSTIHSPEMFKSKFNLETYLDNTPAGGEPAVKALTCDEIDAELLEESKRDQLKIHNSGISGEHTSPLLDEDGLSFDMRAMVSKPDEPYIPMETFVKGTESLTVVKVSDILAAYPELEIPDSATPEELATIASKLGLSADGSTVQVKLDPENGDSNVTIDAVTKGYVKSGGTIKLSDAPVAGMQPIAVDVKYKDIVGDGTGWEYTQTKNGYKLYNPTTEVTIHEVVDPKDGVTITKF